MNFVVVTVTSHAHQILSWDRRTSSCALTCRLPAFGSPTKRLAVWSYVGSLIWYSYQASSLCPRQCIKPVTEAPRNGRCPSRASSSSGANLFPCDACSLGVFGSESASHPPASSTVVWYSVWYCQLFDTSKCSLDISPPASPEVAILVSVYERVFVLRYWKPNIWSINHQVPCSAGAHITVE